MIRILSILLFAVDELSSRITFMNERMSEKSNTSISDVCLSWSL